MKAKMTKTSNENSRDIATMAQNMAGMVVSMKNVEDDVKDIKDKLESNYVTQDQFEPIKRIVYGMVSVILLTVMASLVALVVIKK